MKLKMFGAVVREGHTGRYGFLTCDHSSSSYRLPVFVPLDSNYEPTGHEALGSGEIGNIISCGYVGELPVQGGHNLGWSEEFRDRVLAAGFKFGTTE
jgi:hypothetical protein